MIHPPTCVHVSLEIKDTIAQAYRTNPVQVTGLKPKQQGLKVNFLCLRDHD